MYKLGVAIYKEFLLLKRDVGGLAILFIMPLVLLVTVTLIQNSSFDHNSKASIPIIVIDNDKDELSNLILKDLEESKSFTITQSINNVEIIEDQARDLVLKGNYQMAIVIPSGLTTQLNTQVKQNVSQILEELGVEENSDIQRNLNLEKVRIYFDPVVPLSFKNSVKSAVSTMVSRLESDIIYQTFKEELEIEGETVFKEDALIGFTEINTQENDDVLPNSVQHNVPSWALFAIFFIIIPLSINIVAEKNQGTFVRLKMSPVSFFITMSGKIVTYLLVCLLQFLLMLLVGFYVFPYLGLPSFSINGSYFLLFIMAVCSGLAAIGIGVLLGTLASTSEQSAPFGATLVVILAAIGGIWVPVFVMPEILQFTAKLSPMNWGLTGFYDVIIRNGTFIDILPEICLLLLFFIALLFTAVYIDKKKNSV